MRANRGPFRLSAAYIEQIHDFGIGILFPEAEPVDAGTCRDLNLLASAATQPYSGFGDVEFYPTIYLKAAYLFFHLSASQIFANGNKRTAVMSVDQFLTANSVYLLMDNEAMQALAENTAEHKRSGVDQKETLGNLARDFQENSVTFGSLKHLSEYEYKYVRRLRKLIRYSPRNAPGSCPEQALRQGVHISHEPA